ncbi:DNA-binding NarL/FixJ family response regulator [Paenibacillus endophyticus]|uniref:DNA-binding NarL/FixJ family response regulator n=1 Tax=Paenibacillus endophyticus TaxID=1294268 RepID=A0A7W5GCP4_9BACL|nr:response regulator transcription factor [Paenibacillus endophyticus]MBB3155081.1 DNA-binding NarL/FixJ family response regulator [Paenibacillus endophyticus]
MKIKVIIADDNPFVREGMRIILTTFDEIEVLASVQDGQEAVDFCRQNEVDVALLDVQMPNMNGVEATKLIAEQTGTKALILTTFDDEAFILDAISSGAKGYLLKNNDPERIRDAIITIYNGHNVLQDAVLDKLKSSLLADKDKDKKMDRGSKIDRSLFTDREYDIMSLIAKGLSNREISKKLFISEGTIANHITSILGKKSLTHRTQIAIYFLTGEVD